MQVDAALRHCSRCPIITPKSDISCSNHICASSILYIKPYLWGLGLRQLAADAQTEYWHLIKAIFDRIRHCVIPHHS